MAPLPAVTSGALTVFSAQAEFRSIAWFLGSTTLYLLSYYFFPSLNALLSLSFLLHWRLLSFLFSLSVILIPSKLFSLGGGFDGQPEKLPADTIVVITGAATGLGFESAVQLLKRGAKVIALMRGGPTRHNQVLADIAAKAGKSFPSESLKAVELDLTSFAAILSSAQQLQSETHIDVLLNNAGVMAPPTRESTKDGLELQLGTNHFGHFLLTALLIPQLRRSRWTGGARVVNVSSFGHCFSQDLSESNIQLASTPEGYHSFQVYGMSKLANIYFARELDARFGKFEKSSEDGVGPIHSYSAHPGAVITELPRYMPGMQYKRFTGPFMQFIMKYPSRGALTQLYASITADRNLVGGEYYADCALGARSQLSRNLDKAKAFWRYSETVTAEILSKVLGRKVEADFNSWNALVKK